ncbi:MAG: Gfo/Idh/MocA family oxidoreductase [Chitinophagales bacterium]|nr:Gfo/Idh/MocA family oxidoreductase [Chitinophagales bacterium]
MLRIGVLGTGHLGKIHLKLIREIKDFELVGFFDPNDENAMQAVREFGTRRFDNIDELIDEADCIDIVTNTVSHYDCAVKAIKKSKHIFIEKPLTNTLEEARNLVKLAEEARIKAQVGHVERFNPAFLAIKPYFLKPMFIETHRLAQFNPRGTDVPVVLDLMIHDIDITLNVVKSSVKKVSASGVSVVSSTPDIANARLEFDNGCVANITASRISLKQMRKTRMFQKDGYISIDFLDKKAEIIRLSDKRDNSNPFAIELNTGNNETRVINFERPEIKPINSIKMELELFYSSIQQDKETAVTLSDGYNAMKIAYEIIDKIDRVNSFS